MSKQKVSQNVTRRQRVVVRKSFSGQSLVKQSDREASDMNNVFRRYVRAGVNLFSPEYARQMRYDDGANGKVVFAPDFDFRDAQNRVAEAANVFSMLSASQREYFRNDPMLFAQTVSNRQNDQRLIELGIFKPEDFPYLARPPVESAEDTTPANPSLRGGERSPKAKQQQSQGESPESAQA